VPHLNLPTHPDDGYEVLARDSVELLLS